jgi:hypothetical protein
MEGKVMPFSIDFLSILSATIWAFLFFVVSIIFAVGMLGGEKLAICIIISAQISWVVYFLITLYGKKQEDSFNGQKKNSCRLEQQPSFTVFPCLVSPRREMMVCRNY